MRLYLKHGRNATPTEERMMEIGARVTWSSQSQGVVAHKSGFIVDIVPSGVGVRKRVDKFRGSHNIGPVQMARGERPHESYLIEVTTGGKKAKKSLYWPLVKNLMWLY